MEFEAPDHVFNCVPHIRGNELAAQPVEIGLQVVTVPELDVEVNASRGLAQEAIDKRTKDLIRSRVKYIRNLKVGGREITEFDDFYKSAPPELVRWVCQAVYSSVMLSAVERKNSSPGSASASI